MARAKARHILVDNKIECERIKAEIENGADFAHMARIHSRCPTAKQGGDLGEFGPGQMTVEFDLVAFHRPVGVVHGPVQTASGYHLIQVMRRSE